MSSGSTSERRTTRAAWLVIENQLERTDHGHLGQCLVYASGLDASTVIWVAPTFRDDFRRAFDWLNERTDLGVNFYGVEVGIVQIGDSGPRAPVFEVVARPNNWQKTVKNAAGLSPTSAEGPTSALNAKRQDFFAEVLTALAARQPAVRVPARSRQNWLSFASGPFGYWAVSVIVDGRLRVEAYLDMGDTTLNKQLFDELYADRQRWERLAGGTLRWDGSTLGARAA